MLHELKELGEGEEARSYKRREVIRGSYIEPGKTERKRENLRRKSKKSVTVSHEAT